MRAPTAIKPSHFSEKQWELIEYAVRSGNELLLKKLIEPEQRIMETDSEIKAPHEFNIDMTYVSPEEIRYFLYNSISYERARDDVMDILTRYSTKHGIPKTALRYAVENIDDEYTLKYQSQYSAAIREFLSENDLNAILTAEDRSDYYQEYAQEPERQKEADEEMSIC